MKVTFFEHLRAGVPVTLGTLALAWAWVVFLGRWAAGGNERVRASRTARLQGGGGREGPAMDNAGERPGATGQLGSSQRRGVGLAILATFFFSTSAVLVRLAAGLGPLEVASYRLILGAWLC